MLKSVFILLTLLVQLLPEAAYINSNYNTRFPAPVVVSLPSNWLSTDIGTVGGAGTASESAGVFTLSDRGSQIYGRADSGQFAYRTGQSDGVISARVATMAGSNYAQACVAIRESLLTDAKAMAVCVTPSKGIQVLTRKYSEPGFQDTSVANVSGIAPAIYLRLTIAKNTTYNGVDITAAYSADGSSWTTAGSTQRITMISTGYVFGLFTSSHDTATLRACTFDNVATTITLNGTHYFASTSATGSGDGSFGNPWTLKQALATNAGSVAAGFNGMATRRYLHGQEFHGDTGRKLQQSNARPVLSGRTGKNRWRLVYDHPESDCGVRLLIQPE